MDPFGEGGERVLDLEDQFFIRGQPIRPGWLTAIDYGRRLAEAGSWRPGITQIARARRRSMYALESTTEHWRALAGSPCGTNLVGLGNQRWREGDR